MTVDQGQDEQGWISPRRFALGRAFVGMLAAVGWMWAIAVGGMAQGTAGGGSIGGAQQISVADLERLWPQLTPKQQFIAVEQLLKGGQFDTVDRLLARSRFTHTGDRAIKRFYEGMAARGHGRNHEAVAIFREVLANHPEFARVRLELAHTLFVINEDDSARHNFELVLGGASASPGLQDTVRSYINAIDGRKRWDFTTFLTIAPSTNLNQGSNAQSIALNGQAFTLADKHVKKSGVGVYTGFQAGYRHPLTDTLDLVMSAGAQAKRYRDGDFNDTLVNGLIGPKMRFERGFLGLYGIVDYRWVADSDYAASFGGMGSGGFNMSATDLLFADALCSQRHFDTTWHGTDLTYQNGRVCTLAGRFDHHFDSMTYGRILGTVAREDAGRDHLDNWSRSGGLGVYREIPWGITIYLQGLYTLSNFDGIYPGFAMARHDKRLDVSLNLTKRDFVIFGLAPQLQYTFTHNDSNVPIHKYDAHGVALTLTKRF